MNRLGIQSLNAGAPDLRLSGDHTQRGTYVQRRRAQMAGGGIMGSNAGSMLVAPTADGSRPGYGWNPLDWIPNEIKDPIAKVIPNELKNPLVATIAANYLPSLIPGGDATILEKLGKTDILGPIIGPESTIGRGIETVKDIPGSIMEAFTGPNVAKEELERVVGGYPNPELDPTTLPSEGIDWGKALATVLPFGDPGYVEGGLYNQIFGALGGGGGSEGDDPSVLRQIANIGVPLGVGKWAHDYQRDWLAKQHKFPMDETKIDFKTAQEYMDDPTQRFKPKAQYADLAEGGRIGYADRGFVEIPRAPQDLKRQMLKELLKRRREQELLEEDIPFLQKNLPSREDIQRFLPKDILEERAQGGRIGAQEGGLMDLGGMEKDYRQEGGFVPIGGQEKADDVPARLSKNEFVFTADAVRAAGGGDIDAGAEVMENLMENLEAGGKVSEDSQGVEGAQAMFANTQRLQNRII